MILRRVVMLAVAVVVLIAGARIVQRAPVPAPPPKHPQMAIFAGGCYWCMQPAFDHLPGVISVTAGHAGDGTDRREAVEIVFDPDIITYADLLERFWPAVDPFDRGGQFCDRGSDYRSGIFVRDPDQRELAERSRRTVETTLGGGVETRVLESVTFIAAPEAEQNYYRKHPVRYKFYRLNCGRDARLREVWGK